MTLEEKLYELQGWNIKVGAAVSFVWCGICNDKVFDEIIKVSDLELSNLKEQIDELCEYLNNFETRWNDLSKERLERFTKYKRSKGQIEEFIEGIETDKKKDFENRNKKLSKLKKQVDKFTPFLTREVIKVNDSTSIKEPNTKIIIIKGDEKGQYWTLKEYQEGKGELDGD